MDSTILRNDLKAKSVDVQPIDPSHSWFSYIGKRLSDYQGFHCFPTVPDFADIICKICDQSRLDLQ